jgi:hypothetical protein
MNLTVLRTTWLTVGAILAICLASGEQAHAQRYRGSPRHAHRRTYHRPSYHRPRAYVGPRSFHYPSPRAHRQPSRHHRPTYHRPRFRRADYDRPTYRSAAYRRPTYPMADYYRPSYRRHPYHDRWNRCNPRYCESVRVRPLPVYTTHAYRPNRFVDRHDLWRPATIYRPVKRRVVHRYDPCRTYFPRPHPYHIRTGHSRHHHDSYGFGIGFTRSHHGRAWGFSIGGGHGPRGRGGGFSFYYRR